MTYILQIELPEGAKICKVKKGLQSNSDSIVVELPARPTVAQSRAVWVKSFKGSTMNPPVDGKGFLLSPTGKLKLG